MVAIRIAEEKDLPDILALYAEAYEQRPGLTVGEAKVIFDRIKTYPDYHVYVAELDGRIAGTFALAVMDNMANMGKKSGLVEDVAVSPRFQGQGIGRQMMNFAIERCREKACYKVSLSSNVKRTDAHAFYEKIGFKKHGYSFLTELE